MEYNHTETKVVVLQHEKEHNKQQAARDPVLYFHRLETKAKV